MDLIDKIRAGNVRCGVVGLGYVGLPLAVELAESGVRATGIDVQVSKVESIKGGRPYVLDVPSERVARLVRDGLLTASTDFAVAVELDTLNVCVPTFSFYLTDRWLIRIRPVQVPGRPISCDERDQTKVESLFLDRIEGLRVRRQIRTGEVAVGAVIAAVGFLFGPLLEVTGQVLMGVGILGALHGLLLPSRLVEVQTRVKGSTAPMIIYASRRKSGRKLVRMLRERLASTRT